MRQAVNLFAVLGLLGAVLLGVRGQVYINCVGAHQQADAARTAAIAQATDAERAAQRKLIADIGDDQQINAIRAEVLAAYDRTDAVRRQYPATAPEAC